MAKFEITWSRNKTVETVEQSDCNTVEQYIAQRFGANYDPKKAEVKLAGEKTAEKTSKKTTKK